MTGRGRRCVLAALGVLVATGALVAAPAGAAEPIAAAPAAEPIAAAPAAEPIAAAPAAVPIAAAPAATYPWGCSYPEHGRRPDTAPLGPTPKGGLPTIGGATLAGDGLTVPEGAPPVPPNVAASSWIVADLDSGQVLGALGAHRRQVPASIFKVLMAATVLPRLDLATPVEFTCEDNYGWGSEWDSDPVDLSLALGGVYTVEDLLHAALMKSSNDAANALARVAGGARGTAGTIEDMNALAHRIGAWDTHAATPSGLDPYQLPDELDDTYQVTSAYDMALIFREALRYDAFRECIHTQEYTLPAQPQLGVGPRTISARNANWPTSPGFIFDYPDAIGGKSGYTSLAGNTYVGARERDGRRIVAVVLGVPAAQPANNRAYQQAGALIDWAFALPRGTAPVGQLVQPGEAEALYAAKAPPTPRQVVVIPPTPGARSPLGWLIGAGAAVVLVAGTVALWLVRRRRRRVGTAAAAAPVPDPAADPAPEAPAASAPGPAAEPAAGTPPPVSAEPTVPPVSAEPTVPPVVARGVARVPTPEPPPYPGTISPFMGQPPP